MKRIRLKEMVEAAGVISIVASLVFLAIQVRQARVVALAETDAALLEGGLQLRALVTDNAEIWQRGSTGEQLTETEATVFRNLVHAHNDVAFIDYQRAERLGSTAAAVVLHDFAAFLHRNPGARREWLAREDELIAFRRQLLPHSEDFSFWRDRIVEDLETLDALNQ